MKYRMILLTVLMALLLSGCAGTSEPTTVPITSGVPLESTVPTTIPVTEPEPSSPPAATEPEILLDPGPAVTVDGDILPSGTVLSGDVPYMALDEFLLALDHRTYTTDDIGGYTLNWGGRVFRFLPECPEFLMDGVATAAAQPVIDYSGRIWVPVAALCDVMRISFLEDVNQNHLYCTSVGQGWEWKRGVDIPILMYHGVTDDTWGSAELFVSPDDMEEQIRWLLDNGYDPITFEDWAHLEEFDKPVMLTFDDGYTDNYEELFPILKKYGVKVTIFLIAGSIDQKAVSMTSDQIREMADSGLVSFQSHTYSHPHLSECNDKQLRNEMVWSKIVISRITGYEPFVLCYPYGDRSRAVRDMAMEEYRFALAMNGGLCTTEDEVSQIPRYYISRYTNIWEFAAMVQGG